MHVVKQLVKSVLHHRGAYLEARRGLKQQIGILGAALHKGQTNAGVSFGPDVLRKAGIKEALEEPVCGGGCLVYDYGDIVTPILQDDPPAFGIKDPRAVGISARKVADTVHKIIAEDNRTCLTLGGDHSMTLGAIHGHVRAEPDACVLWIDAHCDINLPQTSPTGNVHGMPLSFMVTELQEYLPSHVPEMEWAMPLLSARDIAFIGVRDVDEGERKIVEKFNIPCFSMTEVDQMGILPVIRKALDIINPRRTRPIHVSFDIDSLDPVYAPSTGTSVPGGLTLREVMTLAEEIHKTGHISSVDVVEVNPHIGSERDVQRTVDSALSFVQAVFGRRREGNYRPGYRIPSPKTE